MQHIPTHTFSDHYREFSWVVVLLLEYEEQIMHFLSPVFAKYLKS